MYRIWYERCWVTNATIIEISDIRTERKMFAKSNRNNKNVYMDITLQTINDETIFLDDEKIDFGLFIPKDGIFSLNTKIPIKK